MYYLLYCLFPQFSDTPLHNASSGGHEAVVDMLLKAKANPSAAKMVMTFNNNYCIML